MSEIRTIKEVAELWNLSERRVAILCKEGRIPGAIKQGKSWLIPADARRIQGTWEEVKCEKAKVLTIKSADFKINYDEAHSYVDENFIYKRGEMVYAVGFTGNRFEESGGGIHVWLDRDAAIAYLG